MKYRIRLRGEADYLLRTIKSLDGQQHFGIDIFVMRKFMRSETRPFAYEMYTSKEIIKRSRTVYASIRR